MREYDLIAEWYATERGANVVGVAESLAAIAALPAGARILDAGCGTGVPITEALVNAGHRVVALDTSAAMLARFRGNLPGTPVVRADVRRCPLRDGTFDAAISWGMMFHLPVRDQAAALEQIARALRPGAPFLFTGAEIDGLDEDHAGITGTMNGVTFHYWAVPTYRPLLAACGMELVDCFEDAGKNGYFTARRMLGSE